MQRMTWAQVWMFYEHGAAHVAGKDVEYDEEGPPPITLPGVEVREDGARVLKR